MVRSRRIRASLLVLPLVLSFSLTGAGEDASRSLPNIVLITVDTLRPDRMSGYGYERPTSPALDALMSRGVRFTEARTTVPLTCPAFASMFTAVEPHIHGTTRNGIRLPSGLVSLPKLLAADGYDTAAIVGNWALQDRLCGLGEHFGEWQEILPGRPWLFGKREADADKVTEASIAWLRERAADGPDRPFLLWTHYMDPHSPYELNGQYLERLGYRRVGGFFSFSKRYDTEVAHVDHGIGRLLETIDELLDPERTIILFTSDHGESLGDHGYWGHGRHVYENSLRVPMSITWAGRIEPGVIETPALNLDAAVTLLGLLHLEVPEHFEGYDWSPVILGAAAPPTERVTYHQAHRGTVDPDEDPEGLRRRGLLEVGVVEKKHKEVLRVKDSRRQVYDVASDRAELTSLVAPDSSPSEDLIAWYEQVEDWLERSESEPVPQLSEEDLKTLRSLGYVD